MKTSKSAKMIINKPRQESLYPSPKYLPCPYQKRVVVEVYNDDSRLELFTTGTELLTETVQDFSSPNQQFINSLSKNKVENQSSNLQPLRRNNFMDSLTEKVVANLSTDGDEFYDGIEGNK
jgi:hypothetical protein